VAGIYTILDLHAVPGYQNGDGRVVPLWEALVDRYRDNPYVAGYNPVNEPADSSGEVIGPFYQRLERAIRAVDSRHILFLDGSYRGGHWPTRSTGHDVRGLRSGDGPPCGLPR